MPTFHFCLFYFTLSLSNVVTVRSHGLTFNWIHIKIQLGFPRIPQTLPSIQKISINENPNQTVRHASIPLTGSLWDLTTSPKNKNSSLRPYSPYSVSAHACASSRIPPDPVRMLFSCTFLLSVGFDWFSGRFIFAWGGVTSLFLHLPSPSDGRFATHLMALDHQSPSHLLWLILGGQDPQVFSHAATHTHLMVIPLWIRYYWPMCSSACFCYCPIPTSYLCQAIRAPLPRHVSHRSVG